MCEIKTTAKEMREKQRECLGIEIERAVEILPQAVPRVKAIVEEILHMEDERSLSDILRDLVQDAGGGHGGWKEIDCLLQEMKNHAP